MPVCLDFFDKFNHFVNVVGCLTDYIRMADIQSINIFHKGFCIKLCNFQNRLMPFFRRFFHFVFASITIACQMTYIGNVHYMIDFVAEHGKGFVEYIQENIRTQIADMCIVVNSRSATVKTALTFSYRFKILHAMPHSVI